MKFSKNFLLYLLCFSLLNFIDCSVATQKKLIENDEDLSPPKELIEDNFKRANHVFSVKTKQISIHKPIYADDGKTGYAVFEVNGIIQQTYKGPFYKSPNITYRFFAEFSDEWTTIWPAGENYIVFANRFADEEIFNVLEFGLFKSTPSLVKIINKLKKQ